MGGRYLRVEPNFSSILLCSFSSSPTSPLLCHQICENGRSETGTGEPVASVFSRHQVLGIPLHQIIIRRTIEGKPYLEYDEVNPEFPNFNFNTSHHGDYVAIASEPLCLVGLDIVSPIIPGKETILEFIQNFSQYFSAWEWNCIVSAGTSNEILVEFYRYWSLKEAFVKAMGTGLAYRLDNVEFHHSNWTNIYVNMNGEVKNEWRFWLSELGKGHLVSIARGHPRLAAESYKRTLKRVDFGEEEYRFGLHLPNASLKLLTVEQMVAGFDADEVADVEAVAYDRSSAPKNCRVYGWHEGYDTDVAIETRKMFLLAEFSYDLEKSNAQTFNVLDLIGSGLVDTVRLDFTSNHGSPSHTCIYRLRVHGHEPTFVSMLTTQS